METAIKYIGADKLMFDYSNPRMIEYGFTAETTEEDIINTFWSDMAVVVLFLIGKGYYL